MSHAFEMGQRFGALTKGDAAAFRSTIRNAYRWFAKTMGPTDHLPGYGDGHLGDGAAVLDQARRFFPASAGRSLGVDRAKSYCLRPSGFAILRNGDQPKSTYLNISFGPFWGWHSHLDTLGLNLFSHGKPLLEELGLSDRYDF